MSVDRPVGDGNHPPPRVALPAAYDALIVDLDGVLFRGAAEVSGSVVATRALSSHGVPWVAATNNAGRSPQQVADFLADLGFELVTDRIVTSAQIAAAELSRRIPPGSRVLAIGATGVSSALAEVGFQIVDSALDQPLAVLQGFGADVSWRSLAEVSYAVQQGAWWIATNDDQTIPTNRGVAPGTGTFLQAVTTATGVAPTVTGKPHPALHEAAAGRVNASFPLVVGDRLDTDIAGAAAAGFDSALVLSGVDDVAAIEAAANRGEPTPTWVADDLLALVSGNSRPWVNAG